MIPSTRYTVLLRTVAYCAVAALMATAQMTTP